MVDGGASKVAARADHSRFVQRIRRRYAAERALLVAGVPDVDSIIALVSTLQGGGRALASALRVARQLVLERLAELDVVPGVLGDATGSHLATIQTRTPCSVMRVITFASLRLRLNQ